MAERLTLLAVFYNEEKKLPGFFKNVRGLFDDIVVVDCGSTDRTSAICSKNGARVFRSKIRYFENNVNYAFSKVKGKGWILVLDADERISPEMKREMGQAIANPDVDVYFIKRPNYFFDGFATEGIINSFYPRLFRKGAVRWRGMPHEKPTIHGRESKLESTILHYAYPTVSSFVSKMDQYIFRLPQEYAKAGKTKVSTAERDPRIALLFGTHGLRMLFLYPIFAVLVMFFRYGLIFNGLRGIIYSLCAGVYAFLEEASYWEQESKKKMGVVFNWEREYPDR